MSRWIPGSFRACSRESIFDAAIIGGGHNGLVAAAYLAKEGKRVVVLERRHLLGGAAVTEEIIPGFKFSRASYLLSLLRPQIVKDLELKKHGLKVYLRNPSDYTPHLESGKSMLLGNDMRENERQIAKFSKADAQVYEKYEDWMNKIAEAIDPLLDSAPVDMHKIVKGSISEAISGLSPLLSLLRTGTKLGTSEIHNFYELITAPASKILDRWFESEQLKATLATDGIIGAMISPKMSGSGYVLLHHVMGELEGVRNAWGYVHGGNGALSMAIAKAAKSHGAEIFINSPVALIQTRTTEDSGSAAGVRRRACGVVLEDGTEITAKAVLSCATPKITYFDLLPEGTLSSDLEKELRSIDYTSPVTKINVALNGLPSFSADPSPSAGPPAPHHQCTMHLNTESIDGLHKAYLDAQQGVWSKRPVLEVCIPSSLDHSLAPPGCHVMSIFSQYTPYKLKGERWTEENKEEYASIVFGWIDAYAPGFKELIKGYEVLTPQDLESVFGLTGGNIFHGAMSIDQLYLSRPTPRNVGYASKGVDGLFLCGSGAHPGGGIMGSPGRLGAMNAIQSL